MTEEPGSERWNWLAEGNAMQARKRTSADALIRDASGRVLLVNPTYKRGWDLPGGMSEANESPKATVSREVREELGIEVLPGRLLVASWIPPHGPWDDLISLIFDGGILGSDQVGRLRVDGTEVGEFDFFRHNDARRNLGGTSAMENFDRALENLASGASSYFERFKG